LASTTSTAATASSPPLPARLSCAGRRCGWHMRTGLSDQADRRVMVGIDVADDPATGQKVLKIAFKGGQQSAKPTSWIPPRTLDLVR